MHYPITKFARVIMYHKNQDVLRCLFIELLLS